MLASQPASVYCRAGHPLLKTPPKPTQVPDYPWAAVQMDEAIAIQLRALFGMVQQSPLPLALSCDNLALLRETTLTSDTLLFTWSAWVQADLQTGVIVDLGACLQPALPMQAKQLTCAIVHMAGRTLSPAAQQLIKLVLRPESTMAT
jgi:DNA-binding transcriptional LysR family regulator